MPVRLRYLAHDLEVPLGQFVIGRTVDCQLSLDDPLVSRRHALLTVRHDVVTVEDLGSRNGVLVNGKKIDGPSRLKDGDRITIGGQEMVVHIPESMRVSAPPPSSARSRLPTQGRPTLTNEMLKSELRPDDGDESTIIGTSPLLDAHKRHPDKRVNALVLIGGVADKALAMGRGEDAERLLSRTLGEILDKAKGGEDPGADLAEHAAGYAVRLAAGTAKGSWVDFIVELYTARDALLPLSVVDELYEVVRKVPRIDMTLLRAYLGKQKARAAGLGPAERFQLQRLEGLERLGALK